MSIRPYASTGIALVSTGVLVAALPAVVPSPTPPDVTISAQVPKDTYADVALRVDAHDLVHAFFATGLPGVTQQILLAIAGGYTPGVDTINAFFAGGVPDVVQLFLIANGDPNSFEASLINGFFDGNPDSDFEYPGIPDVVRQILIANGDPDSFEADLINGFFLDGGVPDVVRQILIANGDPDSFEADVINGFFNGNADSDFEYPGIPEPVRLMLQSAIPDGSPEEALVDAFFLDGGVPAVVHALLPGNPLTDAFFAGGAPLVTEAVLLGVSNVIFGGTESPASEAIRSFFEGYPPPGAVGGARGPLGLPGLTHFIIDRLMGVAIPEPKPPNPPAPKTMLAAASGPSSGTTADLPKASDPVDTDAPTVTLRTAAPAKGKASATVPAAAKPDSAPVTPAANPAPVATDPTPAATDPAPTSEPAASVSGDTGKANDVTDEVKSGNKAEVDPLLLENRRRDGGLQEGLKRVNDFLHKVLGGGKPKRATGADAPADTADAAG
jgi:hypothetical protein